MWDQVFGVSATPSRDASLAQKQQAADTALASLSGVEVLATRAQDGKQWREYLLLNALIERRARLTPRGRTCWPAAC